MNLEPQNPASWFIPHAQVRGHQAYARKASLQLRWVALLTDLSWIISLFSLTILLTGSGSHPQLHWIPLLLGLTLFYGMGFRFMMGRTLGERIWQLCREPDPSGRRLFSWNSGPLFQYQNLGRGLLFTASLMTAFSFYLAAQTSDQAIFSNPFWIKAGSFDIELNLSNPHSSENQADWTAVPFFYSLSLWPNSYEETPVFYRLPYEKGPPERFIGHIVAQWNFSDNQPITLTFEGPKTPAQGYTRSQIQSCLKSPYSPECFNLRDAVISRHIHEISSTFFSRKNELIEKWKLDLFTVKNSALLSEEQTQGFLITAMSHSFRQDRYILITQKGIHQTITLDSSRSEKDDQARANLMKTLQKMRLSDDLSSGIAWIDRELENMDFSMLRGTKSPDATLKKYAEIQSLLLSKISVSPQLYDTYFHLARISLDLLSFLEQIQFQHQNLFSSTREIIESAYRYANDINPNDPRTSKMKDFVVQSGKIRHIFDDKNR